MSRDRQIHEQVIVAVCRVLGQSIASVNTQVENGIVQVSGAAWRTLLTVSADDVPASDVLALFAREGRTGLRVQVEEGIVTVLGNFESPAARGEISAAVATVPGVRGVRLDDALDAVEVTSRSMLN